MWHNEGMSQSCGMHRKDRAMTENEQAAFVKAYSNTVAHHPDSLVADFVSRYEAGEDMDYSFEYTSIVDALGMWHDAIRWHLMQQKGASNV
jgi:hypothetical protein